MICLDPELKGSGRTCSRSRLLWSTTRSSEPLCGLSQQTRSTNPSNWSSSTGTSGYSQYLCSRFRVVIMDMEWRLKLLHHVSNIMPSLFRMPSIDPWKSSRTEGGRLYFIPAKTRRRSMPANLPLRASCGSGDALHFQVLHY
jgi:hypothetical protein